ncbi:sensor domain-containing diguanylate cyclase [Aeromonas media]|uniref:GGDEF domain-containing protein n=1 Tax=Aeromonas media TaxID=651 RepID=UPI001CF42B82|nr:sensor domain-containing diguanylate cyclase [Aeromonas media]UCP14498.1 sensor domain-containing diguanylate cyclase [Aeromonas media]
MQAPAIPEHERQRLDGLRRLAILDSTAEERFDRITRMARNMFEVPISLISLVDEERQWFKSRCGLDAQETPRDVSFCGHAILGEEIFVVEDAIRDPRFADNPLVLGDPHIRFYAGTPLHIAGGYKVGTLCLIDRRPRQLDERQRALLMDLAGMVEHELAAIQLAILDELTGITNRRGFIMLGQKCLQLSHRQGREASLLFLDLDRFKEINDTLGHEVGDDALRQVALLLSRVFRNADIFARLGGDEFVVLLPGIGSELASRVLARFEKALATFNREQGKPYQLFCSTGIAHYDPLLPPDLELLLQQADKQMYDRKKRY